MPVAWAIATWKAVSASLNTSRLTPGVSMIASGAFIRASASSSAAAEASAALERSSWIRVSMTSSTLKFVSATWRRRNRVRASRGSEAMNVPAPRPDPPLERTTPRLSSTRRASRTLARLTPSWEASSRSAGSGSPTVRDPAMICSSIASMTSSCVLGRTTGFHAGDGPAALSGVGSGAGSGVRTEAGPAAWSSDARCTSFMLSFASLTPRPFPSSATASVPGRS